MVPPPLRPALWLFAGLLVIDLGVRATRGTWERYSPDDYAERIDGCASQPRDLIFLGGSPVSEGFDPEPFRGLDWRGEPVESPYSVGLPGGTATDFFFALRHATEGQPPPRLVIYGAAVTEWNDDRNEPHGAYSLWDWGDYRDVLSRRPEAWNWATRRFLEGRLRDCWAAFRERHAIRAAAALAIDDAIPGAGGEAADEAHKSLAYSDALRAGDGYAPADFYAEADYAESKRLNKPAAPFDFLEKYRTGGHFKYVARTRDWCRARGCDFVVVEMPVTADLEARFPNQVAQGRGLMARLRAEPGVRFVPATRGEVGLTDHDFADLIHLNRGGAAKLSRYVRDELAKARP